jgi:hypothetical protein
MTCASVLAAPLPAHAVGRPVVTEHVSFTGFDARMPAGATISVIQRCPAGSRLDKAANRGFARQADQNAGPTVRLVSRELWPAGLVSRYRVLRRGAVPFEDSFGLVNAAQCVGSVPNGARTLSGRGSTEVRVWGPATAGAALFSNTLVSVTDRSRPGPQEPDQPYLTTVRAAGIGATRGSLPGGIRAVRSVVDDVSSVVGLTGTLRRAVARGRFASMRNDYAFTADLTKREPDPNAPETVPIGVISTTGQDADCLVEPEQQQIGAGRHEVTFIAVDGPGSAVIRDSRGRVVYEQAARRQQVPPGEEPTEDGEGSVYGMAEPVTVALAAGEYTVQCRPVGAPARTTRLRVVPARAGQAGAAALLGG